MEVRQEIISLLEEENELLEIAKVVGQDVLSDTKKLVLEVAKAIRVGFLQQSAFNDTDTSVPLEKQFEMMNSILIIYKNSLKLIQKGIPISKVKELGIFEEYVKLKFTIKNDEITKFNEFNKSVKDRLKQLEKTYENHI